MLKNVNRETFTDPYPLQIETILRELEKTEASKRELLHEFFRESRQRFSDPTNMQRMLELIAAYQEIDSVVLKQALPRLSWTHHIKLTKMVKEPAALLFYLQESCVAGWSLAEMVRQINSGLYERAGRMRTNFEGKLSPELLTITRQYFNDPAYFDLSSADDITNERDLTEALVKNIEIFLAGLGRGFSYVKVQFRLKAYITDFLLYHTELNCFVIVEIKMGKFKVEYIGKMNSYLEEANRFLKNERQNDCIGLIYCTAMDGELVLSALKDSNKPIGVATYLINAPLPGKK
jgi:predicted nuclease of restriction endonuclease-like (RecB) superfamily